MLLHVGLRQLNKFNLVGVFDDFWRSVCESFMCITT